MVLGLHVGHYAPIEAVYQPSPAGNEDTSMNPEATHQGATIQDRLPIAISSCLLGELVRYDGRLKRAESILEAMTSQVRWISICPEVGAGLSTPRPAMDLFQTPQGVRMRTRTGAHDHTDAITAFAERAVAHLVAQEVCGMVFKSRSPSCGIGDARLHDGPSATTDGLMVRAVREALPSLPIARDEDLLTPLSRARFIERARLYGAGRPPES